MESFLHGDEIGMQAESAIINKHNWHERVDLNTCIFPLIFGDRIF